MSKTATSTITLYIPERLLARLEAARTHRNHNFKRQIEAVINWGVRQVPTHIKRDGTEIVKRVSINRAIKQRLDVYCNHNGLTQSDAVVGMIAPWLDSDDEAATTIKPRGIVRVGGVGKRGKKYPGSGKGKRNVAANLNAKKLFTEVRMRVNVITGYGASITDDQIRDWLRSRNHHPPTDDQIRQWSMDIGIFGAKRHLVTETKHSILRMAENVFKVDIDESEALRFAESNPDATETMIGEFITRVTADMID